MVFKMVSLTILLLLTITGVQFTETKPAAGQQGDTKICRDDKGQLFDCLTGQLLQQLHQQTLHQIQQNQLPNRVQITVSNSTQQQQQQQSKQQQQQQQKPKDSKGGAKSINYAETYFLTVISIILVKILSSHTKL